MGDKQIPGALGHRVKVRRGWTCPGDEVLAAYADGRLEAGERARMQSHLADCTFCLEHTAMLAKLSEEAAPEAPPALLAKAALLAEKRRPVAKAVSWRWVLSAAAAACLFIAALPTMHRARVSESAVPSVTPAPSKPLSEPSVVRQTPSPAGGLQLEIPREGSTLMPQDREFRWSGLEGSLSYQARLLSANGDVKWESGLLNAPAARIPQTLSLPPGRYYAIIWANLADGKSIKSEAAGFEIASEK